MEYTVVADNYLTFLISSLTLLSKYFNYNKLPYLLNI